MADDAIGADDGVVEVVNIGVEPPPRRRRVLWAVLAVISVAAGAVVVSSSGEDGRRKLPIALGSDAGARGEASAPAAADMAMMAWITYVAGDDLPALGGSGAAYRLPGAIDAGDVAKVARALGLDGEVTPGEGNWRVQTSQGSLEVYEGGGGSWWYNSTVSPVRGDEQAVASGGASAGSVGSTGCEPSAGDPEANKACAGVAVAPPATVVTTVPAVGGVAECPPDAKCIDPGPPEAITPPPDLPSKAEAREIALDLLAATGMGIEGARVTIEGPYEAWFVNVELQVDGVLVSGLGGSVTVGSKGEVTNASGYLGRLERLGDYPVLDTRSAIERLNLQTAGFGDLRREVGRGDSDTPSVAVANGPVASEAPTSTLDVGRATGSCQVVDGPDGNTTQSCVSTACPPVPLAAATEAGPGPGVEPAAPLTTTTLSADAPVGSPNPACPTIDPYVPPEPIEIVLHEADRILVVAPAFDDSGDMYLVPGYRFRGDDAATVDAVAVDDESLAPAPTAPEPGTTEPVPDVPGSSEPCLPVEPGPDGAVPDICRMPGSVPPSGPVASDGATAGVEEP